MSNQMTMAHFDDGVDFTVPGLPVPWQRPTPVAVKRKDALGRWVYTGEIRWATAAVRKGKDGTRRRSDTFTPFRQAVTTCARMAIGKRLLHGALEVRLVFVFARTERHRAKSAPQGRIPLITKVRNDIDNLSKGVLDALSKHAFDDDGQVYKLSAERWYAAANESPHTEISIRRRKEAMP